MSSHPCAPARRRAALLLALAGWSGWAAAGHTPQTRAPTAAETASLQRYLNTLPQAPAAPPAWHIGRPSARQRWQLSAQQDGAPQRRGAALCQFERQHYAYDERARNHQRWSLAAPSQHVWLATAQGCTAPAAPAQLIAPMADAELAALLRQQAALLARARLLFAGNTECARLRALEFSLVAVEPATGPGALPALLYRSDRASSARVSVRRSGAELTAWSASCQSG